MKKNNLIIAIALTFLSCVTVFANDKEESHKKGEVISYTSLEFSEEGKIEKIDFVRASCSEVRDGVTYSTEVRCFLCGPERAKARCKRVLSRRINRLDPDRL